MARLEEVIANKRTITACFLVIAAFAIDPVFAPPATAQEQDPAKVPQSPPDGIELIPVGANRFVIPRKTIAGEFVPAAAGRAQEPRVTGAGPKPFASQGVAGFAPTSAELRAFVEEYTSAELEVTNTIAPRDTGLVVRMPGRPVVELQALFSDAFAGADVNVVAFSRDAGGAVTGFTVNTSGVRCLSFDRVKR